ncbi:MAG: methyltransferase domain-containing protein [Chloroflexi bacterium]|nr:methyltransferase domain-containing protein [Chloroflexota bacterium]
MKVFALTTRGLESVSADEIATLPGVTVNKVAYRRIAATCAASLSPLLELRTVDDVFVDTATWQGIGRPRSALTALGELISQLDLREAVLTCSQVRPIKIPLTFSVTVNFVGKRNYSTEEIKQVCAEGITAGHSWSYTPDDASAGLNVRVFIEHDTAFVGVRLGERPLHRRAYKQAHLPGSLKPSVAAALLVLAEVGWESCVLDLCCGVGTIPIEAALSGAEVFGGDNDPEAVAAARVNAQAADVAAQIFFWDAQTLPMADVSVDRIVSNLPWGRAVKVDAALESFYRCVCIEMRRVIAPGGRIVLLTSMPHFVDFHDLKCDRQIEISLFGQTPTIMIFSA